VLVRPHRSDRRVFSSSPLAVPLFFILLEKNPINLLSLFFFSLPPILPRAKRLFTPPLYFPFYLDNPPPSPGLPLCALKNLPHLLPFPPPLIFPLLCLGEESGLSSPFSSPFSLQSGSPPGHFRVPKKGVYSSSYFPSLVFTAEASLSFLFFLPPLLPHMRKIRSSLLRYLSFPHPFFFFSSFG